MTEAVVLGGRWTLRRLLLDVPAASPSCRGNEAGRVVAGGGWTRPGIDKRLHDARLVSRVTSPWSSFTRGKLVSKECRVVPETLKPYVCSYVTADPCVCLYRVFHLDQNPLISRRYIFATQGPEDAFPTVQAGMLNSLR